MDRIRIARRLIHLATVIINDPLMRKYYEAADDAYAAYNAVNLIRKAMATLGSGSAIFDPKAWKSPAMTNIARRMETEEKPRTQRGRKLVGDLIARFRELGENAADPDTPKKLHKLYSDAVSLANRLKMEENDALEESERNR